MTYVRVITGPNDDIVADVNVDRDLDGVVPIVGDYLVLPDDLDHFYQVMERWLYPWSSDCAAVVRVEAHEAHGGFSFLP